MSIQSITNLKKLSHNFVDNLNMLTDRLVYELSLEPIQKCKLKPAKGMEEMHANSQCISQDIHKSKPAKP